MGRARPRRQTPAKKGRIQPFAPRCPAAKNGFLSRDEAARWMRQVGLTDLKPYRCNHPDCDYWHLGHLPPIVKTGRLPRTDLIPVVRTTEEP